MPGTPELWMWLGVGILTGGLLAVWVTYRVTARRLRVLTKQELEQAAASLRQSEEKFRRLVDSNLIGVCVGDLDGRIFEANQYFLDMLGYTRDDLNAGLINWIDITPSKYAESDQQRIREQRLSGISAPFEKEYVRKDGSLVPVLMGFAIYDQVQEHNIGFVLDLSDRKQAEASLRQSEEKFRRLVDSNLIGVNTATLDGQIFEANDRFLEIVGYTRDDLNAGALNWVEMTPLKYAEIDQQAVDEQRSQGRSAVFEKEYIRKDGSLVPVLMGHTVYDPEQEYAIGFVLDLSDRKQAEALLVLEERSRIARDIHDGLAQAFTSILVHLEVAERKLHDDPAATQKCLQTSTKVAQSGLMDARRAMQALRSYHLDQANLHDALCQIAHQIFAHSGIQVQSSQIGCSYPLPPEVEEALLRIGQEALSNAFKHAQATVVQLNLSYEPSQCVLQIQDDGIGFASNPESINDAYSFPHFGLTGMAERSQRIDAELRVESVLNQGTTITVVVPQYLS